MSRRGIAVYEVRVFKGSRRLFQRIVEHNCDFNLGGWIVQRNEALGVASDAAKKPTGLVPRLINHRLASSAVCLPSLHIHPSLCAGIRITSTPPISFLTTSADAYRTNNPDCSARYRLSYCELVRLQPWPRVGSPERLAQALRSTTPS